MFNQNLNPFSFWLQNGLLKQICIDPESDPILNLFQDPDP